MPRYSNGQNRSYAGVLVAAGLWAATIVMILAVLTGVALTRG